MGSASVPDSAVLRVLLVDNYDSYTYNVYQMISVVEVEGYRVVVDVIYNDSVSWEALKPKIDKLYHAIVLSPGPGTPDSASDVGICGDILKACTSIPILGVCLGHQALAHTYGARIVKAPVPYHGRLSRITFSAGQENKTSKLFSDIPGDDFQVVRYHSLVVDDSSIPDCIHPLAWTEDEEFGLIMALRHDTYPHYGVQFHPESICTRYGDQIFRNFVKIALDFHAESFVSPPFADRAGSSEPGPCPEPARGGSAATSPTLGAKVFSIFGGEPIFVNVCPLAGEKGVDTESLFLHCCGGREKNHQDTFWLDSSSLNYSGARFSYMGTRGGKLWRKLEYSLGDDPRNVGTMVATNGEGETWERTFPKVDSTDFWDCLDEMVQDTTANVSDHGIHYLGASPDSSLPLPEGFRFMIGDDCFDDKRLPFDFQGGFVGYIGYEMKAQFGGSKRYPCGHPDASLFFADQLIVVDHRDGAIFLLELCEQKLERPSEWMRGVIANAAKALHAEKRCPDESRTAAAEPLSQKGMAWSRPHEEYLRDIESCKTHLVNGDSYEICLTNRLKVDGGAENTLGYYRSLRQRNPAPYSAYLNFTGPNDRLSICCSSPERFLKLTPDGTLEAKPIKGTVRRGRTPEEDLERKNSLRCSGKDRAENLMIVDLLRNDLGRVSEIGSVSVPKLMDIESYATVHQMVSTVRGKKEPGATPVDCIRNVFPAGSMTGAPKVRTMEIIDDLEREARGAYSGAIGFISATTGSFDLNVVIRTAVFTKDSTVIGAGGAITIQSEAESEFDEIQAKAEILCGGGVGSLASLK